MIKTGFPPSPGTDLKLNATISTVECRVGAIVVRTNNGDIYVIPMAKSSLILSTAPAYAALETWELLADAINAGEVKTSETGNRRSEWLVLKPTSDDFVAWVATVITEWQSSR